MSMEIPIMIDKALICILMSLSMSTPLRAAKALSDREMLRQEAEHVCYNDAQTLCSDAIPDEVKVTACMKAKRTQLSPECGKVFDRGMKL